MRLLASFRHFMVLLVPLLCTQACVASSKQSDGPGDAMFVSSLPQPTNRFAKQTAGDLQPSGIKGVEPSTPSLLREPTAGVPGDAIRVPAGTIPDILLATEASEAADYRIGALDILEISVYGVPDLTKTVQVSAGGRIMLPLIGAVTAGGKTPTELEADVARSLGEGYLHSPQVSVWVKEALSQRITVGGAVNQPGLFPIVGPTTLLQSIAMARGLGELADPAGVVVFRQAGGQRLAARFDVNAIGTGRTADPLLAGGDVVMVDQSGARTTLRDITRGLPILSVFMPLLVL